HTIPPAASCSLPSAASFGPIAAMRPFSTPMSTGPSSGRVLRRALRMMRSMRGSLRLFGHMIGRAAVTLDDRRGGIAAEPGAVGHFDLAAHGAEPRSERTRFELDVKPFERRVGRKHR